MNFLIPILITVGEVITLDAHFSFVKLGELRLEVVNETIVDSNQLIHYRSTMTSNPALSFLFVLEDRVDSWVDKESFRPVRFVRQIAEKGYEKEEAIFFDWKKGFVFYPDSDSVPVDTSATDILTLFYKLRRIDLPDSFNLIVHAGKVDHIIPCRMLDKKEIKTPIGKFDAIGLKLKTRGKGIFGKGDMEIWMTDDEERLPVMVKASFKFGSVVFRLNSYHA